MAFNDDVKFGVDLDGNLTMTAIDYKDHKGMGPHAHDVDMSMPFSDFYSARGEARPMTDDEAREYLENNREYGENNSSDSTSDDSNSSSR